MKRSEHSSTLALVESPVQLLHVLEWCHVADAGADTRIIVLPPKDAVSQQQLRAMLDYAEEEEIAFTWYDARERRGSLLSTLADLRGALGAAERLVVGDPFSGLIQAMLPFVRAHQVVVVDDGTATMEFTSQLADGRRLSRWDSRGAVLKRLLRSPLGRGARRFFSPSAEHSVTLFTVMPVPAGCGLAVRQNAYEWTRRRFGQPEVAYGADIIGTSLVESGVVDRDAYFHAVELLAAQPGIRGRYYAHRREDDAKLTEIAARTGLRIVRPRVPLEIELRRGPVAEQVISFPSSVGYTLPVVLSEVGSTVTVIDVEPSWIRGDVSQGARSFLATMGERARGRMVPAA